MSNKLEAMLNGARGKEEALLAGSDMSTQAEECGQFTAWQVALAGVEVEAVVGGVLMRLHLGGDTNLVDVKPWLLSLDQNAVVRDAFPSRSNYGNRETKHARAIVINLRITESGKFIDLICQNGDDLSVGVSKKHAETFEGDLRALGKLQEKNMSKVEKAYSDRGSATVILTEGEQFGVHYWCTEEGKNFLDHLSTEVPKEARGNDNMKEQHNDES